MSLLEDLRSRADMKIFGVADAETYGSKAPEGHRPADLLKGARSIVLIGTRMLDLPLDRLPETRVEYTANFHVSNAVLNEKLVDLSGFLEERGHRAFPVPYKENPGWNLGKRSAAGLKLMRPLMTLPGIYDKAEGQTWDVLSYRHAAAEAGLGNIGVNNLLLMPEHGPRVRFVALVTDADLEPGRPLAEPVCQPERCGTACVRACPAGALTQDGGPTDKVRCLKYYIKLGIPGQSGVRCGLCVSKCPVSRMRHVTGAG